MKGKSNLLFNLYNYADHQAENYLTEAFVHLIRHLIINQPSAASHIMDHLTGVRFETEIFRGNELHLSTQDITGDGTPDIRIDAPGYRGYIEVKLDSPLRKDQLPIYRKLLEKSGVERSSLSLLTRYSCDIPTGEEYPDVSIRWFQVAQWMEQELESGEFDPVSTYLVEQFLEFLEMLNIIIFKARSALSEGLRDYMNIHGESLTDGPRLRSLDKLLEHEELTPLHEMMILIEKVLAGVSDETGKHFKIKFDMGKHEGGWIGFNMNAMDYFVQVYISQPELLLFQTYNRPFDSAKWDHKEGRCRKILLKNGWENELNLASPELNFFQLEKTKQFKIIQGFIQRSLNVAEKCSRKD